MAVVQLGGPLSAVGSTLFASTEGQIPVKGQLSVPPLELHTSGGAATVIFHAKGSKVTVDGREVRFLEELASLDAQGFSGKVSFGNSLMKIDGKAGNLDMGGIAFSNVRLTASFRPERASLSGLDVRLLETNATGVIEVASSTTALDGRLNIKSFKGDADIEGTMLTLDGTASRVVLESRFMAVFT